MNDEQIIQLFFTRNEDAIRQTDDRYGAKLTRLSENIVGSREDAQECVNDTYFKAWDTIPPTKPVHFFAYLAKICRHLAFDRLDWNNAAKRKAEVVALTQEMEECIPGQWQAVGGQLSMEADGGQPDDFCPAVLVRRQRQRNRSAL